MCPPSLILIPGVCRGGEDSEATAHRLWGSYISTITSPPTWFHPFFLQTAPSPIVQASLIAQLVKNQPAMQETLFDSWAEKIPWRRHRLPTPVFFGFPGGSAGKESAHNVGDLGLIPGLGRSPGEGKGYPLQYSGLENSMDYLVHGVAKSQTQLSDFHFHFHPECWLKFCWPASLAPKAAP